MFVAEQILQGSILSHARHVVVRIVAFLWLATMDVSRTCDASLGLVCETLLE